MCECMHIYLFIIIIDRCVLHYYLPGIIYYCTVYTITCTHVPIIGYFGCKIQSHSTTLSADDCLLTCASFKIGTPRTPHSNRGILKRKFVVFFWCSPALRLPRFAYSINISFFKRIIIFI